MEEGKLFEDLTDEEVEAYVREKYKDLPHGTYNISTGNLVVYTGLAGNINYKIRLHIAMRDFLKGIDRRKDYPVHIYDMDLMEELLNYKIPKNEKN
jgi:hypothetical protein